MNDDQCLVYVHLFGIFEINTIHLKLISKALSSLNLYIDTRELLNSDQLFSVLFKSKLVNSNIRSI